MSLAQHVPLNLYFMLRALILFCNSFHNHLWIKPSLIWFFYKARFMLTNFKTSKTPLSRIMKHYCKMRHSLMLATTSWFFFVIRLCHILVLQWLIYALFIICISYVCLSKFFLFTYMPMDPLLQCHSLASDNSRFDINHRDLKDLILWLLEIMQTMTRSWRLGQNLKDIIEIVQTKS